MMNRASMLFEAAACLSVAVFLSFGYLEVKAVKVIAVSRLALDECAITAGNEQQEATLGDISSSTSRTARGSATEVEMAQAHIKFQEFERLFGEYFAEESGIFSKLLNQEVVDLSDGNENACAEKGTRNKKALLRSRVESLQKKMRAWLMLDPSNLASTQKRFLEFLEDYAQIVSEVDSLRDELNKEEDAAGAADGGLHKHMLSREEDEEAAITVHGNLRQDEKKPFTPGHSLAKSISWAGKIGKQLRNVGTPTASKRDSGSRSDGDNILDREIHDGFESEMSSNI
ncbi:unnamed protein product [Amoebophrya sp. A25]|nr:unnamed protein product [Amoebophrya sp. A25]|eukprot:GSA25T00015680001.1